jgi:hypothetical protein
MNLDRMRRRRAQSAASTRRHGEDSHAPQDAEQSVLNADVVDLITRSLKEGLLTAKQCRDLAALLTGGVR